MVLVLAFPRSISLRREVLSPLEIIRSATVVGAEVLCGGNGQGKRIGLVIQGGGIHRKAPALLSPPVSVRQ